MPIETVGGANLRIQNHDAKGWSKLAEINTEMNEIGLETGKQNDKMSFSEMLAQSVSEVNGLQVQANESIQKLVSGETKNIHETMLAVEKAEIAFKTMNQIRMKVIDAYKEVMRMQV